MNYFWSLNITQIQKKLLLVSCCNDSNFKYRISMQNFTFNLTVNDDNMTINIYYWNIDDNHLYFDPAMKSQYLSNPNLIYSFDSENILIPYTNWVVGPLKSVKIQNVIPFCNNFKIDCFKIFNVSFDYLKANDNIDVEFDSLVTDSVGLNFTLNSTQMTLYWQTSKDLTFYIIDCFFDNNYLIEDCIISFRKDHNVFRFKSAFAYKNFHIINAENLFYVRAVNLDNNENEIYLFQDPSNPPFGAHCVSVDLYKKDDLLFCLRESDLLIYKLKYDSNNDSLWLAYDKYNDSNFLTSNKQIYIDFIEMYNFFLLQSDNILYFYEILFPINEDICFHFNIIPSKNKILPLPADSDIFILNQDMPIVILIDYVNDTIEQYTIRPPGNFTHIRNFPSFSYNFQSSFPCNSRFLCLTISDDQNNYYLVIYNVTEPTSKLLRYKVPYDFNNNKIFPIIINENSDAVSFFHALFSISSIFVVIDPIYGLSLRLYKVCDIVATIPEIFHDPQIVNQQYYHYTLAVSFTNEMNDEMIFFQIIVNISLLNSVITLNTHNNTVINFINPPSKGSKYILNLTDSPFSGPVQNYKVYNDYFMKSNDNYYYDIYPFLDKSQDFESDYETERKYYGNFKEGIYKDGILIVLSAKNLTFHDVNNGYAVVYFDDIDDSCYDMYIHSKQNLLYLFCKSKSVLHLKCYEFNSTDLLNNVTNNISNVSSNEIIPFKGAFQNYLSVVLSDRHFFFLIDEGYYPDLYKKKKTVYIYRLPEKSNNYTIGYPAIISDNNFVNQSFLMSDAVDIQSYFIDKFQNSSYYAILILMKTNLAVLNCNFSLSANLTISSSEINIQEVIIIEYQNYTQDSFSKALTFYTITLLNMSFSNSSAEGFGNFSLIYILSSNLHIYEFNTTIKQKNISTIPNHIYTKYYSCIFTDAVRPRKFKSFLGSFCVKTDIIDSVVENGLNYFVLHKINAENDLMLAPVLTMPIYLQNYNFQFIAKKDNYVNENFNEIDNVLILPSFSSLFTEFDLTSSLLLYLRKNSNGLTTRLTAYNEISNASIYLEISVLTSEERFSDTYIIIIIVGCALLFLILFGIWVFFFYWKRQRKCVENCEESQFIDNEYFLIQPKMNTINDLIERDSYPNKMGKGSTTSGSRLNVRANSFLRVKQKNAKWIES